MKLRYLPNRKPPPELFLLANLVKKPISVIKQTAQENEKIKTLLQKPYFWEKLIYHSFGKNYPCATEKDYEKLLNEYHKQEALEKEKISEYKAEVMKYLQEMKVEPGPEEYYTLNPYFIEKAIYKDLFFEARSYLEAILKLILYFQERNRDVLDEYFWDFFKYQIEVPNLPAEEVDWESMSPSETANYILESFEEDYAATEMPLFIRFSKIEIIA